MDWKLPITVEFDEKKFSINKKCDYRMVIDCLNAHKDKCLSANEQLTCSLIIFFGIEIINERRETLVFLAEKMANIINGDSAGIQGLSQKRKNSNIVDFEKDFPLIASALLPILGYDIREERYLHWWTFLGAFREIRSGVYADVLRIRAKRAAGVALTKEEKAFYARNTHIVDITCDLTDDEREFLFSE